METDKQPEPQEDDCDHEAVFVWNLLTPKTIMGDSVPDNLVTPSITPSPINISAMLWSPSHPPTSAPWICSTARNTTT